MIVYLWYNDSIFFTLNIAINFGTHGYYVYTRILFILTEVHYSILYYGELWIWSRTMGGVMILWIWFYIILHSFAKHRPARLLIGSKKPSKQRDATF